MQKAKIGVPVELLERYCRNHRVSFIASFLLCAMLAVALWDHVPAISLISWLALVGLTQAAQAWYAQRYLRAVAPLKLATANWMPGLLAASVATGASWSASFFLLGLSGSDPIVMLLIFAIAGVTAYAGIAKSEVLLLGMAFEIAALLPMSAWLFIQADALSHAQYMGLIALLYLSLLYFLLRQINAMAVGAHTLRNENSELNSALARVQMLERESAMFRNMFEMISDPAIAVHDPDDDMRIIYANAAACSHLGVDEETVLTLRPMDFDVRIDAEKRALLQEKLEQHGRFGFQSVHRRANGEEVPVEVLINTFEHEGDILRVSFVRNIAARLAAEQRMRELELTAVRQEGDQRIGRYLECVPGLFFTLRRDHDGKLSMPFARGSSASFQGLSPETVADSIEPLLALCHPDDTAPLLAELHVSALTLRPCHVEFRIGDAAEGVITLELTAQPQPDANDADLMEWHGFMQDITVRKRMEEKLRMKEHALDHSSEAMYLIGEQGRFVYVNEQACRTLGYSREELLMLGVADIDPDFKGEFLHEKAGRLQAEGGVFVFETMHRRRDDSLFPVEIQLSELEYNGHTLGMTLARDITERKAIEKSLYDSERMLQEAQRIAHVGSWDVDMVNDNLDWSDEIFRIWEIDKTKFKADFATFLETVHPEDRARVSQTYNDDVINHALYEVEHRLLFPDGRIKHVLERGEPQYDAQGKPMRFIGTSLDITERKRMEAELAERERDFRSLAESSPDFISRYDREGRTRYMNTSLLRLLGLDSVEEVMGKRPSETWSDGRFDLLEQAAKQAIESASLKKVEVVAPDEKGGLAYSHIFVVPEFGINGDIVGTIAFGRDITAIRETERRLASFIDNLPGLAFAFHLSPDGKARVPFVSAAIEELYGLQPADVENDFTPMLLRAHPDDHARIQAAIATSARDLTPFHIETRISPPDRPERWIEVRSLPERLHDGSILSYGLILDITERKQIERALLASEEQAQSRSNLLHAIVESSPDVIVFALDTQYRYLSFNRKHKETMQAIWGKEIAAGMNMLDVIGDHADRDAAKRGFDRALTGESFVLEEAYGDELRSRQYWQNHWSPIRSEAGEVVGLTCFVINVTARRQMEVALAARERDFRSLAENIPDNIARWDVNGHYLFVNPTHERLLGKKLEKLIGQPIPDSHGHVKAGVMQVAATGQAIHAVRQAALVEGSEQLHDVSLVPEFDETGKVISVLGMGRDMTERYRMLETIAERQAFLDSLFEAIPVPVFYKDREGRYQGINRAFEQFYGTTRERMVGKSVFDTHPRELAETYHAKDVEVFERRVALQQYEYQIKNASNGSLRDVLFSKAAFSDARGEVIGLIGAVMDITERKQAEVELQRRFDTIAELNLHLEESTRALEEQTVELEASQEQIKLTEAWYRGILHSAPDGMMVIDERGIITMVNAQLERMFGYAEGELVGQTMEVLVPAEARGGHVEKREGFVRNLRASREPGQVANLHARHRDGHEFAVDVTLARLPGSDGNMGSICAAVRDITERKKTDDVLQRNFEEISLLNRQMEEKACILEEQTVELEASQEQLKDALEFTEGVINAIPDILFELDGNGRYLNVWTQNPHTLAAQKAALLGMTVHDVLSPESAETAMRAIREAEEHGHTFGHTLDILQLNGETRWYEHSLAKKQSGGLSTYIALSRDVTERVRAEQLLDDTRKRLQSVLQTIPDLVWMKDIDGVYMSCNHSFERFFGASEAEIVGKNDYDFVDKALADFFREKDQQALQHGCLIINEEWVTFARDGRNVLLETRKVPVHSAEGNVIGVLGVGRDITERKQMEEALALREQEFRSLLENTPDVVVRYDSECRRLYVNSAWERVNGLAREDVIGKSPLEISSRIRHMAHELEEMLRGVVQNGVSAELELEWVGDNGEEVCFSMHATPEFDQDGQVASVLTMARDISQRKFMERLLAVREQESRTLLENTPDTIARYDHACRRVFVNPALSNQVAGGEAALLGKTPTECPGGGNSDIYEEKLRGVFASGDACEFELHWPVVDGGEICSLISLTPELDDEGNVATVLAVGRDITELNAFRAKIHQMAFYDPLTSLPNRALFNDRLRQMITDADWHGQTAGVMMIDMDRFKVVNDTMGHAVGDELLCETGARLSACVRAYDTVARLGGDEFAILLPDLRNGDDLGSVADKLLEKFKEPFLLEGKEVFISCSIGIALYPDDSVDAEDLLKFADSAMYFAKRSGRNNFRFYSSELTDSANERLSMESELRRAVERGELELHYQPKVDLVDCKMIGSEALLRWNHPQRGSVSPVKFIPVAEDSGLIVEVGEWVLREACRMACVMNGEGRPLHKIAINLSARQFQSNDLVRTVSDVLDETGCYPEWIELEITESLLLDEEGEVLEILNAFRALGITIAIDDFGTGYSSLSYLARFPINTLKIDRSFISTVTTDNFRAELVKAVLSIAKCLGQQVVAEGVETREQAEFLQAHGCQIAQGYLFSRPQPSATFLALPGRFDLECL